MISEPSGGIMWSSEDSLSVVTRCRRGDKSPFTNMILESRRRTPVSDQPHILPLPNRLVLSRRGKIPTLTNCAVSPFRDDRTLNLLNANPSLLARPRLRRVTFGDDSI